MSCCVLYVLYCWICRRLQGLAGLIRIPPSTGDPRLPVFRSHCIVRFGVELYLELGAVVGTSASVLLSGGEHVWPKKLRGFCVGSYSIPACFRAPRRVSPGVVGP